MRDLKSLQPQEIEVFYILPAIRRELAKSLKAQGLDQKKVAKILNLTEPAVSQYINEKRATEVSFSDKVKKEIDKCAANLKNNGNLIQETQKLLKLIKNELVTCDTCRTLTDTSDKCKVCFE